MVLLFQALVGDRYGYRPLPAKIPFAEFQMFLSLGHSHNVDTQVLLKWYRLDLNAVPKVFQLQPITIHFPNYSSKDTALKLADRDAWWKTFLMLQKTLWSLVGMAVEEGKINKERAHIYLQSGILFKTKQVL